MNCNMNLMEEVVFQSLEYQDILQTDIANICSELSKLKANNPDLDLDNLMLFMTDMLKNFDDIIADNESNKDKLNTSLRETAVLVGKLEAEKRERISEMDQSIRLQDVDSDEKLLLGKKIKELEDKLKISGRNYKSLILENNTLKSELDSKTKTNNNLLKEIRSKVTYIENMKCNLNVLTTELAEKDSLGWSKDKWVDDSVLNEYFSAMSDSIASSNILFLGPSATLVIKLSPTDAAMESLKLSNFSQCNYVLLCISDASDGGKDDSGSHWSLLFLARNSGMAFHFDSLNGNNKISASNVAVKLGIESNKVIEMPCTQQKHSFECGIHVLANAKYVAYHYCAANNDMPFLDWYKGIKPSKDRKSDGNVMSRQTQTDLLSNMEQNSKWCSVPTKHKNTLNNSVRRNLFNNQQKLQICNQFEALSGLNDDENTVIKESSSPNLKMPRKGKCPANPGKVHLCNLSLKQLIPSNCSSRPKLTVASDSQGKTLSNFLEQRNNNYFNIFNHCQPGATIQPIMNSLFQATDFKSYTKKDYIVVIGGTNDITTNSMDQTELFLQTFKKQIKQNFLHFEHTNLIISTVPFRYDLSKNSAENNLIKEINDIIRQECYNHTHTHLLDVYLLKRFHHTRHGLHVNRKGKNHISKEIMHTITHIEESNVNRSAQIVHTNTDLQTSKINTNIKMKSHSFSEVSRAPTPVVPVDPIQIKEACMSDEINRFRGDCEIAFAHCISGDFGDPRQMTAGVAVTFRKEFGRPRHSDCLKDCLTIQKLNEQATVYGLVTKPTYSSKPSVSSYNKAFDQMISDFKEQNLKKLICPAMGCIRDLISPIHFAEQIVKFHRETGAFVDIIVRDERATRNLRNGLKHEDFVKLLRTSITEMMCLSSICSSSCKSDEPVVTSSTPNSIQVVTQSPTLPTPTQPVLPSEPPASLPAPLLCTTRSSTTSARPPESPQHQQLSVNIVDGEVSCAMGNYVKVGVGESNDQQSFLD